VSSARLSVDSCQQSAVEFAGFPVTAAKTLTITICSYQRKDALVRLVSALDDQARSAPADWEGIDVVVTIDGSTDGSTEALAQLEPLFPLEVITQANSGLSTARNTCLEHAKGELVYFLDDDLVPAEGTVLRHRHALRDERAQIVLGPQVIPASFPAPDLAWRWWEQFYRELAGREVVDRSDLFSIANSSGPTEKFRSVGGFDTSFVGYGLEDHEIGLRLMEAGVFERYDPEAVAWHYNSSEHHLAVARSRETGRNAVRLLRRHPDVASVLFPDHYNGPGPWLLDCLQLRSPRLLAGVAAVAEWLARGAKHGPARVEDNLWWLASAAAYAAGVADLDRALVPSFLGHPSGPTTGRFWHRAPAPSQK
jgi:GT2 family glycosyltransferase